MKLSDKQIAQVAKRCIHPEAGASLEYILHRRLGDDESQALDDLIAKAIVEGLSEFEFAEKEKTPQVDFHQTWADDHKDMAFIRPNGKVTYTVTGEIERHRHGLIRGVTGVLVKRSSDGKVVPMTIRDLEEMIPSRMLQLKPNSLAGRATSLD